MRKQFTVARNTFSITAPDTLPGRDGLMRRFGPFETRGGDAPKLEIEIKTAPLPAPEGETVYAPEYDGIGSITTRALRQTDGTLAVEFALVTERQPRLLMKIASALDKAEIIIAPLSTGAEAYLLSHAIMIAYMLATTGNGTLLIHASAVTSGGKAYLFQGKSGTGKSTHSRLWLNHITGTELLNDDHPVIRIDESGTPTAYGSPWSGKTDCYRNAAAPIGAFVRIVRGKENELRRLAPLNAYASLTASVFYLPLLDDQQRDMRHLTIERLAATTPCFEMHCRPDADAALTCMRGVESLNRNQN